jgi:predicted permease
VATARRLFTGLSGDLRLAWRSICRMPVLAAVVVTSLAAGIGVNTVVFSWVRAVTVHPLPGVAHGARLHYVAPLTDRGGRPGSSWLEFEDLARDLRGFRSLFAVRMTPFYIGAPAAGVDRAYGMFVSDGYFPALALTPAAGRFPGPGDRDQAVTAVSYGFALTRFGGAGLAVGRTLVVNDQSLTVLGVTPPAFQGTVLGMAFDLFAPAALAPRLIAGTRELVSRGARDYEVMGLLADGVTREQAQADVDAVMARLAHDYPESNRGVSAEVLSYLQALRGPQRLLAGATLTLQAMMLVLLAAVCGNTANLLLARASARQNEAAIRLALGAGRGHVVRLLMIESVLLSLCGAAGGLLVALWGTRSMPTLPLTGFPIHFETPLDGGGLAFAIALGLGCGALFGFAPAWHLSRVLPHAALRGGALASLTPRSDARRRALMGVQAGFAVVVLVVTALFVRSFLETRTLDSGFASDGILLAAYDLANRDGGPDAERVRLETARRILDSVRGIPEVSSAAIAGAVPLDIHGWGSRTFTIEGRTAIDGSPDEAVVNTVTRDYFDLMGIALIAGRSFTDRHTPREESAASSAREAVVNLALVRRYLPAVSPAAAAGRWIRVRDRVYIIVGVVETTLYNAFGEPPTPAIYFSFDDAPQPIGELHVRARAGREGLLANQVRQKIREADRGTVVVNVRTLNEHINSNMVLRRVPAQMLAVLGPMLLALAAIGIYAVVDFAVSRRTAEIGLRIALGSTTRRLTATFSGQHMAPIGGGVLLGGLVALIIAIDVGVLDPIVLLGVPLLLLAVAGLACWLPLRRAASIDPTAALRSE